MLNHTSLCLLCIHLLQCRSLCFVCCKGIKNIKKQKMENPCQIPEYCKNLEKPKKTKTPKRENLCISKTSKKQKKKGQNLCKTKKPKKKWQNLCPSVWHGVNTFGFFGFLVFPGKTKKQKKKQNGRTYVPVSGMGSVLLVFWVFLVFPGKTKKTKWQNLCPSVWHGVSTFGFFGFQGFCNIQPFLKRL